MKRLENKVAVITGASSGIGAGTALLFAQEGANVVLVARRQDRLEAVAEQAKSYGVQALVVAGDVTDPNTAVRTFDETIRTFGRVDILVNNAGIADKHLPITRCSKEWWDEVCDVDQTSIFYFPKEALKYMEPANSGSIVNVSSIGGVYGNAGIAYSAAKAAVIGMTKNIAIQFAETNIRCNAVCPGPTPTELNTPDKVATFDMEFNAICKKHNDADCPRCSVEDQAYAILFFASDESKSVTGQSLVVDHGRCL